MTTTMYYPVMLRLTNRSCLVVGGGSVAERKIASLLEAGARVKVISPAVTPRISQWEADGCVEVVARAFESGDAGGAFLVFAATSEAGVNAAVCEEAQRGGALAAAADRPEAGDFITPAVLRRGKLVIAVSTSGAGPAAASRIRDGLAEAYGDEYAAYVDFLSEFRQTVRERIADPAMRRELLQGMLGGALDAVREGRLDAFRGAALAAVDRQMKTEDNRCER